MSDGLTLPVEVRAADGVLVAVLLMNRKAYGKSLERRELWIVHPQTGRVLPLESAVLQSLVQVGGNHYQATLQVGVQAAVSQQIQQFGRLVDLEVEAETGGVGGTEPTLEKLRQVIAQRRRDLPEGSYTTHLFQKGEAKIRKKTGEEAIELVLAQENSEIISEAADFIYHLMVLLEVRSIPVRDVLAELDRRLE